VLAFIYFLLFSLVIAIWAAFDNTVTLIAFVASTIAIFYIAFVMRSTITFDVKYLGNAKILDSSAMRLLRTRDADPAAYLAIRFWIPTGLKIAVVDSRDPTPYWLITSKRSEEIAALLNKSSNF